MIPCGSSSRVVLVYICSAAGCLDPRGSCSITSSSSAEPVSANPVGSEYASISETVPAAGMRGGQLRNRTNGVSAVVGCAEGGSVSSKHIPASNRNPASAVSCKGLQRSLMLGFRS